VFGLCSETTLKAIHSTQYVARVERFRGLVDSFVDGTPGPSRAGTGSLASG
jgi:hypothetical protein